MPGRNFIYSIFISCGVFFAASPARGQERTGQDSVKLYTTYTFTIISSTPLNDKNVQEIESLFKPIPMVRYFDLNSKTNKMTVQVQDMPDHPKLVSSEIKQIILDIGDYELDHGFIVEERKSLK